MGLDALPIERGELPPDTLPARAPQGQVRLLNPRASACEQACCRPADRTACVEAATTTRRRLLRGRLLACSQLDNVQQIQDNQDDHDHDQYVDRVAHLRDAGDVSRAKEAEKPEYY